MKKRYFVLIAIVALIIYIGYTGGCEFSTATITDVKVCTSINNNQCGSDNAVITGNPSGIYVSCKVEYVPEDTKVEFTCYYLGASPKYKIGSLIKSTGDLGSFVDMQMSYSRPNNGWPKGDYEVVIQILVEGKDPKVKKFSIQ